VRIRAPFEGALLQGTAEVLVHADPRPGHVLQAVEARVEDGAWRAMAALPSGDWHATIATTELADGVHTLQVRARDDGATGAPAKVQVRVLNGGPPPPSFAGLPASVSEGALGVRWTDTDADSYELEVRFDSGAATFTDLHRSLEPGTSIALRGPGDHALRVRGWHGDLLSPWSAEAHVLWTEPSPPQQRSDASPPADDGPAGKRAPGPELALLLLGAAALALARRRR
jgi:MYXO-CTERM domain-containing protein